ncbi:hypothetical protein L7F22_052344 [Adiantum nelumboides]|nr:hypothetical protein [Adiantum nelumboides]
MTMSKHMQKKERVIDFGTLDLQNNIASPDATWAIDFLARKLQEAMENPSLQGVVHTQLQERHLIVSALEENSPSKSQHEASKRGNNEQKKNSAATRRGQSPPHEAKSRKKTKDTRDKSPVYDVDSLASSNSDVHPRRRRRALSPSPSDGRRSSSSCSSHCSEEGDKKGEKKRRKNKPSSSPPSQSSSDLGISSSSDTDSRKSHKRKSHQRTHAVWKRLQTGATNPCCEDEGQVEEEENAQAEEEAQKDETEIQVESKVLGGLVVIVVYVDDVIIIGDDEDEIKKVKDLLKAEFDIKDLGELMYFLGIEVIRIDDGIWLMQRKYVLDMLKKFGMIGCKPIATPIEQNAKLRADAGEPLENPTLYRQIVGSLIYATLTRPDMSHDVGVLNADWAGSSYDRRSTSGYVFSLGSATVSWSSKKQTTVALSSTEAEYRGAAMAAQCEVAWLCKLLHSFDYDVLHPITLFCDNMSSIQLANNPVFHARTKHIEVHYHYIKEKVLVQEIDLVYVDTHEQVADIFTKSLGAEKLNKFRDMLGVQDFGLSLRGSVERSSSTCDPPG